MLRFNLTVKNFVLMFE
uniref:Uncharacterized protein n=1 Tax=Anguilla anguilla TaxID=7936 RepID=A0A0E9W4B1_ANGAN